MYRIPGKDPVDYVALEIDVDFVTGRRAGNINPKDPGLRCLSLWQNFELGKEMRLIVDNRDPSRYEGIEGITIHRGATAINARARELFKARYAITQPELFRLSVEQKGISLRDILPDLDVSDQIKMLRDRGALGILCQEPETVV